MRPHPTVSEVQVNTGETSERRGKAQIGFPERLDTFLRWTEFCWTRIENAQKIKHNAFSLDETRPEEGYPKRRGFHWKFAILFRVIKKTLCLTFCVFLTFFITPVVNSASDLFFSLST